MAWLPLVLSIVQLLIKLPGYIETIKEWLEVFGSVKGVRAQVQARAKLHAAINVVLADQVPVGADCPVAACVADLRAKYGAAA